MLPSKHAPQSSQRGIPSYSAQKLPKNIDHIDASTHMIDLDLDMEMEDAEEAQLISDFIAESRIQKHFENFGDDMDIDRFTLKTEIVPLRGNISYLTIDTNFILSQLEVVEQLRQLSSQYSLMIIIPLEVLRELDGLKNATGLASDEKSIGKLARTAIAWVFRSLAENDSNVKGQANAQKLDKYARKDDAILDCCLYFQKQFPQSLHILMSNDKNLCLRALVNEILTISFQKDMSPLIIAEKVYEENVIRFGKIDDSTLGMREVEVPTNIPMDERTLDQACATVYREVKVLVLSMVLRCMEEEYGKELDLIRNYSHSSCNTLWDEVERIIRFWVPVFSHKLALHPFEEDDRNKRHPVHADVPKNAKELREFVQFWSDCLMEYYEKGMEKSEVASLKVLTDRWAKLGEL